MSFTVAADLHWLFKGPKNHENITFLGQSEKIKGWWARVTNVFFTLPLDPLASNGEGPQHRE